MKTYYVADQTRADETGRMPIVPVDANSPQEAKVIAREYIRASGYVVTLGALYVNGVEGE